VRHWPVGLLIVGCGKDSKDAPRRDPARDDAPVAQAPLDAAPAPVTATTFPDLATALRQTIPEDARVIGFGELHMRTDRKQVRSTLSRFTQDGLPGIAGQLSDLVVETWIVDPKCGQKAQTATVKMEMTVRRPQETKSDIALLAEAARAAEIQPHAMKVTCEDYDRMAPANGEAAPEVLLDLTTRELTRIAGEAVHHRDKKSDKRPWVALYGGALHNDRFPTAGVEDWSYAGKVDELTNNRYVEVDLIVPELAEADPGSRAQPWFSLVTQADDKVRVWKRGERSFVAVLPRGS
jgi:hypothetical protein